METETPCFLLLLVNLMGHAFQQNYEYLLYYTQGPKLPLRNSRVWQDSLLLQKRTIAYNDEAAHWSRSNHVLGTKFSPQVMAVIATSLEH
jgi:hypothetical protein